MVDIVPQKTRSRMMAGIRAGNTKPEQMVRRALRTRGIGYRLTRAGLPFRPDIILARYQAVIFVHGCFWHRHGCRRTSTPVSNADFWQTKFAANVARDARAHAALREAGWRVATIWECGAVTARFEELADVLVEFLRNSKVTELEWPMC